MASAACIVPYPEVGRVHSELEGVQLAEGGQATLQVVDLAHGVSHSAHDGGTMLLHLGGVRAHIRPVRKVGLGLGVYSQHPVRRRLNKRRVH